MDKLTLSQFKNVENVVDSCIERIQWLVKDFKAYAKQIDTDKKHSKSNRSRMKRIPKPNIVVHGPQQDGSSLRLRFEEDSDEPAPREVQKKTLCLSIKKSAHKGTVAADNRQILSVIAEESEKRNEATLGRSVISMSMENETSAQDDPDLKVTNNGGKEANSTCGINCPHANESFPSRVSIAELSAHITSNQAPDVELKRSLPSGQPDELDEKVQPILLQECKVVLHRLLPTHRIFQPKVVLRRLTRQEIVKHCGISEMEKLFETKSKQQTVNTVNKRASAGSLAAREPRVRFCSMVCNSFKPIENENGNQRSILKTPTVKEECSSNMDDENLGDDLTKDVKKHGNAVLGGGAWKKGKGVVSGGQQKSKRKTQVKQEICTLSQQPFDGISPVSSRKIPSDKIKKTRAASKRHSDENQECTDEKDIHETRLSLVTHSESKLTRVKCTFKTSVKSHNVILSKISPNIGRATRSKVQIEEKKDKTPNSKRPEKKNVPITPGSQLTLLIESFRR